jgi:hypothetical protein
MNGKLFLQNRDTNLKLACLPARSPLPVAALPFVSPIPSAPLTNLDTNFTNGHESILTGRAKLCDASGERARPYTSSPLQQFAAISVIRVWFPRTKVTVLSLFRHVRSQSQRDVEY